MTDTSKPASPQFDIHANAAFPVGGLTLREYAAVHALAGCLANENRDADFRGFAHDAVRFADALIAELEKGK